MLYTKSLTVHLVLETVQVSLIKFRVDQLIRPEPDLLNYHLSESETWKY